MEYCSLALLSLPSPCMATHPCPARCCCGGVLYLGDGGSDAGGDGEAEEGAGGGGEKKEGELLKMYFSVGFLSG